MRIYMLLGGVAIAAGQLRAQSDLADTVSELVPHVRSEVQPTARFEIVQSHLAAKFTFKLDKFSGHVWQLVRAQDGSMRWETVPVLQAPKILSPATVRFQIFTSGIAGVHTFLLDTVTGSCWIFTEFKDGPGWNPMTDRE